MGGRTFLEDLEKNDYHTHQNTKKKNYRCSSSSSRCRRRCSLSDGLGNGIQVRMERRVLEAATRYESQKWIFTSAASWKVLPPRPVPPSGVYPK